MCLGCPTLLPLNHTTGLDFVQASLTALNTMNENVTYTILDVGRMTSQVGLRILIFILDVMARHVLICTSIFLQYPFQVVSGGPLYTAEYVVIEAACINDTCVPLNDTMAVSTHTQEEHVSTNAGVANL